MPRSSLLCALLLAACSAQPAPSSTTDDLVEGLADTCLAGLTDKVSAPIAALQEQVAALRGQLEALATRPPPSCPHHWSRHGDRCYLIPSEKNTWPAANRACAQLDSRARLASLHRDNFRHVNQVVEGERFFQAWIGLVRFSSSPMTFGWVDGSPLDYTNWGPGEPNDANDSTEDCVHLLGTVAPNGKHTWNDIACSSSFRFICQINLTTQ